MKLSFGSILLATTACLATFTSALPSPGAELHHAATVASGGGVIGPVNARANVENGPVENKNEGVGNMFIIFVKERLVYRQRMAEPNSGCDFGNNFGSTFAIR